MRIFANQKVRPVRALRDTSGVSVTEFALALPLLVAILIPLFDLGMWSYAEMQVMEAAQAGAHYAELHGWASAAIQSAVTSATSLSSISATPAPTESCGCADGTSIASANCSDTCPNGQAAGTYVTVNAQALYQPLLPYPAIGKSVTLNARAMVRIR